MLGEADLPGHEVSAQNTYYYGPGPISASQAIVAGELHSVFCSSSSSGTLAVYDGNSVSGTPIIASFSLVAGTTYTFSSRIMSGNVYLQIGGTATITPFTG